MKSKIKIAIIQNVKINDHRLVHTHGIANELVKRGYSIDVIIQDSDVNKMYEEIKYNIISLPGETYSIFGQIKFMIYLAEIF